MQPILGDLSEQSFSPHFPISANHQLLRESEFSSNSHTSKRHQQVILYLRMKDFRVEREVTLLFELPCPKPLLVSTNHRLYHLISSFVASLLEKANAFQPCRRREVILFRTFSLILPNTTFHARGRCGGSGGGQICHDGYRFCCIICIVGDIQRVVDPLGLSNKPSWKTP